MGALKNHCHPPLKKFLKRLWSLLGILTGSVVLTLSSVAAVEFTDGLFNSSETDALIQVSAFDSYLLDEAPKELSLEERLAELEGKYTELDENYGKLEKNYSELKSKLKNAAFSGHRDSTMKISGRVHEDYWAFPGNSPGTNAFETGDPNITPQDRVGFRRLRFGVAGNVWKTMEYKIEMEFAGGNKVEFRDAYLGWRDVPYLQTLLVGNQKRPYGLDHINSSRYNVFLERPFIVEGDDQDSRRFGVQSWGFSDDLVWNWRYGAFNQRLIQDEGVFVGDHFQGEIAGRLATTFWYDEPSEGRGYGHFALAGTLANPDGSNTPGRATNEARFRTRPEARSTNRWLDTGIIAGADNYQLLAVENVWNFGPMQIVGEYLNTWVDRNGFEDVHFHGGYAYIAYFLTGEFMPWDRETGQLARPIPLENFFLVDTCNDGIRGGWGAWQIAYRWSHADFTDEDILGGVGDSHTLGLNWYWNPYARMQFNTVYGEIDEHAPVAGQTAGHYTITGLRFMVDF